MVRTCVLLSLLFACRADERDYQSTGSEYASAQTAESQVGKAVSVSFENLPSIEDDSDAIDVVVSSQNGAVEYKHALLAGDAAAGGSSGCESADYGDFVALTQTITHRDLQEDSYLLCAIGKDAHGVTQKTPTAFAWSIVVDPPPDDD